MYFLFLDDSGSENLRWTVFSGACLSEIEAFEVKKIIAKIKASYNIDLEEELLPFKQNYRNRLSKTSAQELTLKIYRYLDTIPNLIVYGVCFYNKYQKSRFRGQELRNYYYKQACDRLYNNFDRLLSSESYPKEFSDSSQLVPKFGMMVVDAPSSKISRKLLGRIMTISARGTEYRPANLVFWGISFTSSEKNFGIEIAGFIAFALRKAIVNDDLRLINIFKSKFYRDSDGYIDNRGMAFFDGKTSRGILTRLQRKDLLEDAGENFKHFVYEDKI